LHLLRIAKANAKYWKRRIDENPNVAPAVFDRETRSRVENTLMFRWNNDL